MLFAEPHGVDCLVGVEVTSSLSRAPPMSIDETAMPRTWGLGVFCVSGQVRLDWEFLMKID